MAELSEWTMTEIEGGNEVVVCFFMGALFAAAISSGNIFAAAGSGIYLAANCFN